MNTNTLPVQPQGNKPGGSKSWGYYYGLVLRKLWSGLAILLVSLAVLISLLRAALPHMDSQKHYLENWLNESYGIDIEIGYISAMWKGHGPAIVLKDLSLGDNKGSPVALHIDETQIELDFWASLRQQQIRSQRFNLIGMTLEVELTGPDDSDSDFPVVDALQTVFLEQLKRFSVTDSQILLKNKGTEQRFQIQQLSWLNEDSRHQGVGLLRVAELARNSAHIVLDLQGSKDDYIGTLFAEAEDLDLSPWLKELVPTEYELRRSRGNMRFWMDFDHKRIRGAQAELKESQFLWQGENTQDTVELELAKGHFLAKPNGENWDFNFNDFSLIVNDRVLSSDWRGRYSKGIVTFNAASDLLLNPLLPLLPVFVGEQQVSQLLSLQPHVKVTELQVSLSSDDVAAKLAFSELSLSETSQNPGINAISGELAWRNMQGQLSLFSEHNYLQSEKVLGYLLPYDELSIQAYVDLTPQQQRLSLTKFVFENPELSIHSEASYGIDDGILSAKLVLSDSDIDTIKSYLPDLMGTQTRAWLRRALRQGNVQNAHLIWQGKPLSFPFEQGEGVFQAALDLKQMEMRYDSDWPLLTKSDVSLLFENESLALAADSGEIAGVVMQEATGFIPQLDENSYIQILSKGAGTGQQVTTLFQNSSLKDSVGNALDYARLTGGLNADLDLMVPLTGENIVAKAQVHLRDNRLDIPKLDITLEKLNGVLQVNNDVLTVSELSSQFLGQTLQFNVTAQDSEQGYDTDINFAGNWDLAKLLQQHYPKLGEYVFGSTDWQGQLNLLFPKDGYSYNLQINSQLQDISLALPSPVDKMPENSLPIFIDSEGDEQASTVRVLLGRDVKFNGILPHDTVQFSRAHLSVGGDNFVGMGLGFSVSGDLQHLDYGGWHQFLSDLIEGLPEGGNPILSAPQRVFIESETLDIAGQQFNDVEILAKNRDLSWEVKVDAEQTRADLVLHKEWLNKGIEIEADFLKLYTDSPAANNEAAKFERRSFPPIKVACKNCTLDDLELGKVTLAASRNSSGMKIDSLVVESRDGVIRASGDWFIADSADSTRLQGVFESNDFGAYLKSLNFDSGIRDSDARMDFDLTWTAPPYDYQKTTLGGSLNWRLGDGYLTEISDKGARLLSVLSLDSLRRKLTLDFRDVFAKGFFYEKMQGTFQINNGLVSTQDTLIDGSAAGVKIRGTTNLADNTLNYRVDVKPNITSSLPVLVAWMVNPATAVAALAFDEVLSSANVVSGIEYALTGTLQEPQITLMEQTNKLVELPAKTQGAPNKATETPRGSKPGASPEQAPQAANGDGKNKQES